MGAELVIFLKRDHGALLQITGRPRKALQYEIGNAITATRMTRHQIPAALKPHSQRPSPLSSSSVRSSPGAKEAGPRCFNPSAHGQIMLPQKVGRQLKLVRITSAPGQMVPPRRGGHLLGAHPLKRSANPLLPFRAPGRGRPKGFGRFLYQKAPQRAGLKLTRGRILVGFHPRVSSIGPLQDPGKRAERHSSPRLR